MTKGLELWVCDHIQYLKTVQQRITCFQRLGTFSTHYKLQSKIVYNNVRKCFHHAFKENSGKTIKHAKWHTLLATKLAKVNSEVGALSLNILPKHSYKFVLAGFFYVDSNTLAVVGCVTCV